MTPDSKITNQSEWGPINDGKSGANLSNRKDNTSEGQPESIDIKIPTKEEEKTERQLEKLAEYIPTLSRPRSHPATSRLPPITTVMAMQTTTKPVQTLTTEVLRHGRDVHLTWVKSFTETLSNKGSGF